MTNKDDDSGGRGSVKPMRWYRLALFCGLFPMALGTADFVLWFFTDWDYFAIAGIYIAGGGVVFFLIGIACTITFIIRATASKESYIRAAVTVAILILNFPLCAAFFSIALKMLSTNVVTVENNSDSQIGDLVLTDPTGREFHVEMIESGGVRTSCLDFSGEGTVTFSFTSGSETHSGLLLGYISGPMGHDAILSVSKELELGVTERIDRVAGATFLRHCMLSFWL